MNRSRVIAAIFAASLPLAACATTGGSADSEPPSGSNGDGDSSASEAGEEPAQDEPSDEPSEGKPVQPELGHAFTWENGLTVKTTKPVNYQPSEYASLGKGEPLRLTITVINKTGEIYEPSCDYMTMQSGNTEAEQIFDSGNGLEGTPSTKLLDGREAKYDIGFTVSNPKDLVFEFQPCDFELESALFLS